APIAKATQRLTALTASSQTERSIRQENRERSSRSGECCKTILDPDPALSRQDSGAITWWCADSGRVPWFDVTISFTRTLFGAARGIGIGTSGTGSAFAAYFGGVDVKPFTIFS